MQHAGMVVLLAWVVSAVRIQQKVTRRDAEDELLRLHWVPAGTDLEAFAAGAAPSIATKAALATVSKGDTKTFEGLRARLTKMERVLDDLLAPTSALSLTPSAEALKPVAQEVSRALAATDTVGATGNTRVMPLALWLLRSATGDVDDAVKKLSARMEQLKSAAAAPPAHSEKAAPSGNSTATTATSAAPSSEGPPLSEVPALRASLEQVSRGFAKLLSLWSPLSHTPPAEELRGIAGTLDKVLQDTAAIDDSSSPDEVRRAAAKAAKAVKDVQAMMAAHQAQTQPDMATAATDKGMGKAVESQEAPHPADIAGTATTPPEAPLEAVAELRTELTAVSAGLAHLLAPSGPLSKTLSNSTAATLLKHLAGELGDVQQGTATIGSSSSAADLRNATETLKHALTNVMDAGAAISEQQERLVKERDEQAASLLMGVLMKLKDEPWTRQVEVLLNPEFSSLPAVRKVLAAQDETTPLYKQVAAALDSEKRDGSDGASHGQEALGSAGATGTAVAEASSETASEAAGTTGTAAASSLVEELQELADLRTNVTNVILGMQLLLAPEGPQSRTMPAAALQALIGTLSGTLQETAAVGSDSSAADVQSAVHHLKAAMTLARTASKAISQAQEQLSKKGQTQAAQEAEAASKTAVSKAAGTTGTASAALKAESLKELAELRAYVTRVITSMVHLMEPDGPLARTTSAATLEALVGTLSSVLHETAAVGSNSSAADVQLAVQQLEAAMAVAHSGGAAISHRQEQLSKHGGAQEEASGKAASPPTTEAVKARDATGAAEAPSKAAVVKAATANMAAAASKTDALNELAALRAKLTKMSEGMGLLLAPESPLSKPKSAAAFQALLGTVSGMLKQTAAIGSDSSTADVEKAVQRLEGAMWFVHSADAVMEMRARATLASLSQDFAATRASTDDALEALRAGIASEAREEHDIEAIAAALKKLDGISEVAATRGQAAKVAKVGANPLESQAVNTVVKQLRESIQMLQGRLQGLQEAHEAQGLQEVELHEEQRALAKDSSVMRAADSL